MKPWPTQALLEVQKLRFSICNIGPELFIDDEELGISQDYCTASKPTTILPQNLKYRQLAVPSPTKIAVKKKKNLVRHKSQDLALVRRQASDDGLRKLSDPNQLAFPQPSRNSPVRIFRQSIDMKGSDSGSASRRLSVVNVISLNEQAGVKKNLLEELDYVEDQQQKFAKKYIHFKRTQNKTQTKRLGRFKSLAEIENRANILNIQQDGVQSPNSGELGEDVKEKSYNEGEISAKKRRKEAFMGKVNMSKCFTDRVKEDPKDKEYEKQVNMVMSQRYSIMDNSKSPGLVTLPTQENYLVVPQGEGKSRNSSFSLSNTSREPELTKPPLRAHPVKLPRLKSLGKRKDFGLSSVDTHFFSIGKTIVSNLEDYDYKKKQKPMKRLNTHNNSKSEIKPEDKVLKKSQSMNSSLMIEENASKEALDTVEVIQPQEKNLVKK